MSCILNLTSLSPLHSCLVNWKPWINPIAHLFHAAAMQINITGGTMLTTLTLIILTLPGLCYYSKWVFHTSSSLFNPSHHLPLLASYFTKKREVEAPTTKDFHYHIHPCSSLLPACYCRLITTVSTWRNSVLECRIPSYSRMLLQYITPVYNNGKQHV